MLNNYAIFNRGGIIKYIMELPKTYLPSEHEASIYNLWEQNNVFAPSGQGEPYAIVMPPPNANAHLHIGYALTAALEDIPVRYHRMKGRNTLLLPGADHAGFETQSVYEKHLAKEGKSRFDFSREELYRQMYDFVALNRQNFEKQFRQLGISCDWSRFTFTLDDKIVKQAYSTFKKMWDDGLIYRGERLVNYCTQHRTGFADIEVEYREAETNLWYIRYPLVDGSGEVVVATTRPETMLGDTGVAVHPDDERYTHYVGKTARVPLTDREVPILADSFVELGFGTGAVKLTPAHDQNDFDAAERHDLPKMTVVGHDGKMTSEVPEKYRGLTVAEARATVVADLEAGQWLVKTEQLTHNVGHCYKCGTVIEPLLMEQWFVNMQPLAKPAIEALKANQIVFYPETKQAQLVNYLENLRDWNISRQIAWGIPIPAFRSVDDAQDWLYDERVDQETIEVNGKTYSRDPDVFDTWFSSSSWPYATLGLGSQDFDAFYPLSLMETGGEILYPWVSRMLMLGLYNTGQVPFKAVYIHGYVMAEDGSKMSKSIGNVIDPSEVIDEFGSDALRMGIISGRAPAVNRGYDRRRVEEARNFCNKLWNMARFMQYQGEGKAVRTQSPVAQTSVDHWALGQLNHAVADIGKALDEYRFAEAYDTLYHFVWDDIAAWYVEASKVEGQGTLLSYLLERILIVAHPFAPFVTEAIWQTLGWGNDGFLAAQRWPETIEYNARKADEFVAAQTIITEVRAILKAMGTAANRLYHRDDALLNSQGDIIKKLAGLNDVKSVESGQGIYLTTTAHVCWLDIDRQAADSYLSKLEAEKQQTEKRVANYTARLNNDSYVKSAPEHIVAQTRQALADTQADLQRITDEQQRFSQL